MKLREMTLTDAPAIIALGRLLYEQAEYQHQLYQHRAEFDDDGCQDFMKEYVTAQDRLAMVVEIDGQVAGFFFGEIAPTLCSRAPFSRAPFSRDRQALERLCFIHPEARGGGAGLMMLHAFELWAASHDIAIVSVDSLGDDKAEHLLRRCGYQQESSIYKRRIDA